METVPQPHINVNRPVRTYNTACVYYHKFRLVHPDSNGYIVGNLSVIAMLLAYGLIGCRSRRAFHCLQG